MNFYHRLTLGIRRNASPQQRGDGAQSSNQDFCWEGGKRFDGEYEEFPESRVLEALRGEASAYSSRFWLVLGEPGAGKSTLFREWFFRWAGELEPASLGMRVPVLVRLRQLRRADTEFDGEELAERLWALRTRLDNCLEPIYSRPSGRLFRPVWLLDGLDEIPAGLLGETLIEKLANLPGQKVLSCRTAVYDSLRRRVAHYQDQSREYEVLGLKPPEQITFLTTAFDGAEARARVLHSAIWQNRQISVLASNPLMLGLIAQVSDRMSLPRSRAEFYQFAVSEMWHAKLEDESEARWFVSKRDAVLTRLAGQMELNAVQASTSLLIEAASNIDTQHARNLAEWLERSGVLRIHQNREVYEFAHLTFQEYYLARVLEPEGLAVALERYWVNSRYDEVLALLTSILLEQERYEEVEQGIRWLVTWGEKTHQEDPGVLWKLARSPLEVALHVLGRSGASLDGQGADALFEFLWARVISSRPRKLRIAKDRNIPTKLLANLVEDEDEQVRRMVAANTSTPAEVLVRLAVDTDLTVRSFVGGNTSTPPQVLARLATHGKHEGPGAVALNSSTPGEVLMRFARDQNYQVRRAVAHNSSTPGEVLAQLAEDRPEVSVGVARNASAPAEVLTRLAQSGDLDIPPGVAGNANTPADVLARLAVHQDHAVRMYLAGNTRTPAEVLARLAVDEFPAVRSSVIRNTSTPVDVRARLIASNERDVQFLVARESSTPAEVLARVAADQDESMRAAVASNASTPPEVLKELATDENSQVRRAVATNPSTQAEVLAGLAGDQTEFVRSGVAENTNTPAGVLADLGRDEGQEVLFRVAGNTSTPPDVLARLVEEGDERIAGAARSNVSLLLEDI